MFSKSLKDKLKITCLSLSLAASSYIPLGYAEGENTSVLVGKNTPMITVPASERAQPIIEPSDLPLGSVELMNKPAATNSQSATSGNNSNVNALPFSLPEDKIRAHLQQRSGQESSINKANAQRTPPTNTPVASNYKALESDDFYASLVHTYKFNPTLQRERENVRLAYEQIFEARTGWLPQMNADASIYTLTTDSDSAGQTDATVKAAEISVQQPIYQAGRTNHATEREEYRAQSAFFSYEEAIQDVLVAHLTSYTDVVTAKSQLDLNRQNVNRLEQQYSATQQEFDVGLLTMTDLSQSQARLAEAKSDYIRAQGVLNQRISAYKEISGYAPELSFFVFPDSLLKDILKQHLPATEDEAQTQALAQHPSFLSSQLDIKAAQADVEAQESELYPEFSLNGSLGRQDEGLLSTDNEQTSAQIGVSASIPLFNSGITRSKVRQAKLEKFASWNDYEIIKRQLMQQVSSAWNDYNTAISVLDSTDAQLKASKTAREGVYNEREVGTRTVLDALDADQEFLDAQIENLLAKRDLFISQFVLLQATGQLSVENLSLPLLFNQNIKQELSQLSLSQLFSTSIKPMDNF